MYREVPQSVKQSRSNLWSQKIVVVSERAVQIIGMPAYPRHSSATCKLHGEGHLHVGITYGGGSVSSVGTVARDSVRIGRDGSNVLTIDLLFGCSEDTNYDYFEAGIIGFGSSIFSFSEQVSSRMGSYKAFKW
jgi:hypothetical protein